MPKITINGKEIQIPAIVPHLSRSPGQTEFAGSELGCHNEEIYQSVLGIKEEDLHLLAENGVI